MANTVELPAGVEYPVLVLQRGPNGSLYFAGNDGAGNVAAMDEDESEEEEEEDTDEGFEPSGEDAEVGLGSQLDVHFRVKRHCP